MSGDASWQLNGSLARLQCGELTASLDAARPQIGLHNLACRGRTLNASRLLAVLIGGEPVVDAYRRGGDLIVRYCQTSQRPFTVEVYWRASKVAVGDEQFACCDLLVSVQTQLLDSRPEVDAASGLGPSVEIVEGSNFYIAQFADSGYSYVELDHPDDALTRSIEPGASGSQISTRLFGQPLEKGVILRSRLRGLFVPRLADEALARQALDEFAALPPPLTT